MLVARGKKTHPSAMTGVEPPREHPAVADRCTAIRLAARDASPGARELVLVSLRDEDLAVRAAAVTALGWFQEPWSLDELLQVAASEANGHLRANAYWAMAGTTDPRVLDALIAEIARPRSVRRTLQPVAEALREFRDPRVLPALQQLAEVDDPMTARLARESIASLAKTAAI